MVQLNVPDETAERVIEQMKEEVQSMTNTLNSYRSNNLSHTDSYHSLYAERDYLQDQIEDIEAQLYESENDEEESEGLGNLFG